MKIGKFKKIAAIGLALTMAIGLLYTSGTVNAVEENPTEDNGLVLNKTAVFDEGSGKYKITLDAYTTGITETIDTSKPTDIVLVLDQSGSMAEKIDVGTREYYTTPFTDNPYIVGTFYQNSLYVLDGDSYYPVKVDPQKIPIISITYAYKFSWTDSSGQYHETEELLAWDSFPSELDGKLYVKRTQDEKLPKIDALRDAVTTFRNEITTDATENNVDHRVAIVGFGSKSGDGNNTEVLSINGYNSSYDLGNEKTGYVGKKYDQLKTEDYENALVEYDSELLDYALAALDTEGATETDLGLEMAKNILDNNPSNGERNQVVVLFTDGSPTRYRDFQEEVATGAIGYAKELKDKGIPVYTVGVFDDEEPNMSKIDQFMNYTSSNHPYATGYNHGGQKQSDDYYFTASNAGDLVDIFEQISESISKPSVPLTTNTTIKDYMSNYFTIDTSKSYKVEKIACSSYENGSYVFDGEVTDITEQIDNVNGINIIDNKLITVSGYDYNANLVSGDSPNNVQGSMLRITFYAKPIDGFIGGLSVPTNGNNSGLYLNGTDSTAFENFEMPYVDVDLNYDYDVTNQGMYVGNDWKDVQKFLNVTDEGVAYKIGEGLYNTKNEFVNDFVDIIYTIKIKQKDENNQEIYDKIGTYTVENGKSTGTLSLSDSFNAKYFKGTQEFVVSVDVINKKDQQQSSTDNKDTQIKSIGEDKKANLYIFVPTIETKDSNIYLGKEDKLNQHLTERQWVCTEDASISESAFEMGDKPNLVFEYTPANNENSDNIVGNTFTPDIVGQHEFNVTVKNSITGVKITDATVCNHNTDICETDSCNKKHFYVTVVGGSITILKQIDESSTIDLSKGEPTFTFKVEQRDGDSYKTIGYKTIHMKKINDQWQQNAGIIFNGLSVGEYRITELKTMRFDVESVYNGPGGGENLDHNDGSVTITIGGSYDNDITLTYENKVKSSSYESDGSGLINKFESNGGKITVRPERLYDNATE